MYGASGYTGRLVAECLVAQVGDIKWAMAGRSASKLAEVRDLIGASKDTPLIVADANDEAALSTMATKTAVVLSTAGPYQLYGDRLLAAWASTGTDYLDLTGESNWIAKMMATHEATARASSARLVFSCGFDSVPFDLGVMFTQNEARKKFGTYAPRVRGRVRAIKGSASGGTVKGDRDPGYGSTSKIIAECAICLASEIARDQVPGGCWTSASAMGEPLLPRLQARAGLTFAVEG